MVVVVSRRDPTAAAGRSRALEIIKCARQRQDIVINGVERRRRRRRRWLVSAGSFNDDNDARPQDSIWSHRGRPVAPSPLPPAYSPSVTYVLFIPSSVGDSYDHIGGATKCAGYALAHPERLMFK